MRPLLIMTAVGSETVSGNKTYLLVHWPDGKALWAVQVWWLPWAMVKRCVILVVATHHPTLLVLIYTTSHRNYSSMHVSDLSHTEDPCWGLTFTLSSGTNKCQSLLAYPHQTFQNQYSVITFMIIGSWLLLMFLFYFHFMSSSFRIIE